MFGGGLIEEQEVRERVAPEELDVLLGEGWRHFGTLFFRYNLALMGGRTHLILPLRIDLGEWEPTRSQRRVVQKNQDLRTEMRPAEITPEKEGMFFRHAERFRDNRPSGLGDFLHWEPATIPCRCEEIAVYSGGRLVAASFMAMGREAVSSVYGMYEPDESKRSLGIFTMLEEIRFAREMGKRFYYSGYTTLGRSHYDYKKGFSGLYGYDWEGNWVPWSGKWAVEDR